MKNLLGKNYVLVLYIYGTSLVKSGQSVLIRKSFQYTSIFHHVLNFTYYYINYSWVHGQIRTRVVQNPNSGTDA